MSELEKGQPPIERHSHWADGVYYPSSEEVTSPWREGIIAQLETQLLAERRRADALAAELESLRRQLREGRG